MDIKQLLLRLEVAFGDRLVTNPDWSTLSKAILRAYHTDGFLSVRSVKYEAETCAQCGKVKSAHCSGVLPGFYHPALCAKQHHEFKAAPDVITPPLGDRDAGPCAKGPTIELCRATFGASGDACDLPSGHEGEHRGMFYSWPDAPTQCAARYLYQSVELRCEKPSGHNGAHEAKIEDLQDLVWLESIRVASTLKPGGDVLIVAQPGEQILSMGGNAFRRVKAVGSAAPTQQVEPCPSKYRAHECSAGAGHSGFHRAKMNETQELFWLDSYAQTTSFPSMAEFIPAKPGYRILDIRTARQPVYIQENDPRA
jgi:hypothetical protein